MGTVLVEVELEAADTLAVEAEVVGTVAAETLEVP